MDDEAKAIDREAQRYQQRAPPSDATDAQRQMQEQIEASLSGSKLVMRTDPNMVTNFYRTIQGSMLAAVEQRRQRDDPTAAPLPIVQMMDIAGRLYLGTMGRSSSLARSIPADVLIPPAVRVKTEPSEDQQADPNAIPRAPPIAGPTNVKDGASEAIDIRTIALGAFAAANMQYHLSRASLENMPTYEPYCCQPDHVAWCLTAPHGPFEACALGDGCAGKTMRGIPAEHRIVLKCYVSPHTREEYERTGRKPPLDEVNRPHLNLCIIDFLVGVTSLAKQNFALQLTSGVLFPHFYNPTGRPKSYAPSALCGWSSLKLQGITRSYRLFCGEQLLPGRVSVSKATFDSETGQIVVEDELGSDGQPGVPGFVERSEIVMWRPECETTEQRPVHIVDPRPFEAPPPRPHKAPIASEGYGAVPNLVPMPITATDAATQEREARLPVLHMLPRKPAPTNISYGKIKAKGAAKLFKAAGAAPPKPAAATESPAEKRKSSKKSKPASSTSKKVKTEPPPPADGIGALHNVLERLKALGTEMREPKN